jgi:predicted MFS family arabinose efflux permease
MSERTEASGFRALALVALAMATTSILLWGGSALSPGLGARFQLTATGIGVVLGALSLGAAVAMIPAGAVVDRRGTRAALTLGVPLAAASLAGAAISSTSGIRSFPVLLVCFGLHGAACTLISQSTAVAALASVPVARRGLALGVRQSSISAGGLIAAGLLPFLYARGGVPLALAICAGLIAVVGALAIRSTPDTRPAASAVPLRAVLGDRRLHLVLAVALCMVIPLTAVLSLAIPAASGDGWSTSARVALFVIVSSGALSARVAFGVLADRGGGSWRLRTLRVIAVLTVLAAVLEWVAWRQGEATGLVAMIPLAIGALGSNGVLYLVAAELLGHAAAGRATAVIGVALFGGSALWAPILGRVVDRSGPGALWIVAALGAAAALACTRPLGRALAAPR